MSILVTGVTGLVGNNVVRLLLERGQAVRVLVREGTDERPLEGLDVERVIGDIRDAEAMRRACQGAAGIVHSAGLVKIGWTRLEEARAINVEGTANLARLAREAGIRMVFVSSVNSLAVLRDGTPADEQTPLQHNVPCPYVVTKQAAELLVLDEVQQGLQGVIVNPGYMLGPWDWKPSSGEMLLEVARKFTPFAPRGGVAVCDVRDVAAGILSALEKGRSGQRYILGGHNLRYLDLWQIFADITNTSRPFFRMTNGMGWIGGAWGDMWTRLTGKEGNVNSAATRMSGQLHYYSSAKAESELGYTYGSVEQAARDAWEWFQKHGYI
ncbi:MAG: NAD-dependent epimerase/dehydratase family protein [Pirellulaceae bacterium]